MPPVPRGTVRRIQFDIDYPDGSTKTSELSGEGVRNLYMIAFDEAAISDPDDARTFNSSEDDHKKNPTMLVYQWNADRTQLIVTPFCPNNGEFPCQM